MQDRILTRRITLKDNLVSSTEAARLKWNKYFWRLAYGSGFCGCLCYTEQSVILVSPALSLSVIAWYEPSACHLCHSLCWKQALFRALQLVSAMFKPDNVAALKQTFIAVCWNQIFFLKHLNQTAYVLKSDIAGSTMASSSVEALTHCICVSHYFE